jgi:hypothetical protein
MAARFCVTIRLMREGPRTGLQEQDSNHLPLLRSKERGGERRRKRPGSEISG